MIRKIGKKTFRVFGYDVESHNDEESIKNNTTGVWLSVFAECGQTWKDDVYYYDVPSFLARLEEESRTGRGGKNRERKIPNLLIYVYNLAHEWSFLLPVLISMNARFSENLDSDVPLTFNSVSNKTCASVWESRIRFGKKHGEIVFRDLAKIFPGGLRKVAESFGLPTQKGDLDYTLNRLHGHIVTDEERLYCFKDVEILLEILNEMDKRDDKDFWKSCSSASYSMNKMIRFGYPNARKPMKSFRKEYPLLGEEENSFLREGVEGGITYATPNYQFKNLSMRIGHIDIHQAHPNSAYRYAYPYGRGDYFVGEPPKGRYMSCCRIRISYSGVKLHSIIKLIGHDMEFDKELVVWDFEIATMKKCYLDLEVEYIDGYAYKFKRLPWKDYYLENYMKREKAKKEKDEFSIMFYKLLNNASYGKLLERPHNVHFENCILDGLADSIEVANSKEEFNAKYTYLPVGSSIPARTRVYLIETALKIGWQKVVYFDTDSIFYITDEETEQRLQKSGLIGNELGQFSHENFIVGAQFTAPKRYKIKEETDDGVKEVFHCAGINFENDRPSFDDLDLLNGQYWIKGRKRAKGGTLIILKKKKMKVVAKYASIFEKNVNRV